VTHSPAIVLMGPTSSGKTELAAALARLLPAEIVSVDSALVYRGLDIGTAKPSPALRAEIPHHLIDLVDPAEPYSAGRFRRDALAAMAGVKARKRVPILVGGTMMYFRALLQGLAELPEADPAVRARIDEEAAHRGWPALHAELTRIDPVAASRIQPGDSQRIQRALEVWRITGVALSALQAAGAQVPAGWRFLKLGLAPRSRDELHGAIERRFHGMLAAGLLEEVAALYRRGDLHAGLPSIRAVGYRQLWAHMAGECGLEEAVAEAIAATRRLAKRQMTWLRAEPALRWLADPGEAAPAVAGWLRAARSGTAHTL
jgi:tRNA dimethylallyltransferase